MPTECGSIAVRGNTSDVYINKGIYTFVRGSHTRAHTPDEFPEDFDALILETGGLGNYITYPAEVIGKVTGQADSKDIIAIAASKQKPIYLLDPYMKSPSKMLLMELGLVAAEFTVAATMLPNPEPEYTLLTNTLLHLTKAWLLEPAVMAAVGAFNVRTGLASEFSMFMQKVTQILHPELFNVIIGTRNKVFAHKERWLNDYLGDNQHFVTVMGIAHKDTDEELLKPNDQRLRSLKRGRWLWNRFTDSRCFYSIQRFDYKDNKWESTQTLEVPDLKALVES